jgi:hypothetical protein
MRSAAGLAAAFVLLSMSVGAGARAEAIRTFKVSSWSAGAYRSATTKRFSHCVASAPYDNGATLLFSVDRNYNWSVAFRLPDASLIPDQTVKLELSIDDAAPTLVVGSALTEDLINVRLSPTTDIFNRFRLGSTLKFIARDVRYKFSLTDTARLLPALVDCVNTSLNPIPMQTAIPPTARVAEDYRAEATTLLANLLSLAGVPNFKIELTPREAIGTKAEAYWSAGPLQGALLVLRERGIDSPADVAPIVIGFGARLCKGSFLSGALPAEEDGAMARAFTRCESDKGAITAYYITLSRPGGGYYVFMTATRDQEKDAEEADAGLRTVALKVIKKPRER